MALPICAEFFIRTFFHIIRFLISHLNLILFVLFLVLLSFLFRRSIRLILGVIGYGINAIGVIPVISLSYDWLTPFLEAITWGGMALSANMFFLGKVLHNKITNYGLAFLDNWAKHFHGEFLFLSGDEIQRNRVPETGQLYLVEVVFIKIIISKFVNNLEECRICFLSNF